MATPSIKGSTIAKVVEDVRRLRDENFVTDEEIEGQLDGEALAILDAKFNDAGWYPLSIYEQYVQLLLETEGEGDPEYLRKRGCETGNRLMKAGLYQQLEFLSSV